MPEASDIMMRSIRLLWDTTKWVGEVGELTSLNTGFTYTCLLLEVVWLFKNSQTVKT